MTWLIKNWKLALIGAGTLVLVTMLVLAKRDAAHWQKQAVATQAAFDKTVADYRTAAAKAQADATANAKRVLEEQQRTTKEISDDYQAQLAGVRARADALRVQLAQAAAHPGGTGTGRAPQIPAASGGPDAAAAQDGLPAPGWSLEDRVIATEQAIQLEALQAWIRKQAAIDFQGAAP